MRNAVHKPLLVCIVTLPLAACAGAGTTASLSNSSVDGTGAAAATGSASLATESSQDEMSCKKLTGLVQVRLLQIRDYDERNKASLTARALQYAETNTTGGSSHGIDPDGQHATDLAALKSYNEQLAAKGCKSYDLDKELQARGPHQTPTASIAPPKMPAVASGSGGN